MRRHVSNSELKNAFRTAKASSPDLLLRGTKMKKCRDCDKNLSKPHGNQFLCAECSAERKRARSRKYHWNNRDSELKKMKIWFSENRQHNEEWREENKRRAKAWRAKNKKYIRNY